jgi:hypothetical protein
MSRPLSASHSQRTNDWLFSVDKRANRPGVSSLRLTPITPSSPAVQALGQRFQQASQKRTDTPCIRHHLVPEMLPRN